MFTARYGRYIPVRQVAGTRTAHYRAVPPKINRRRSISAVGGRLKREIDRRRYEGLSEMFLSCPVPKLLLLAGTDRLDRCYLADTSLYISLVQHVVTDERSIATAESR
ncbi:hypothetical protein GW17_00017451 [Ensete ventricosum]|nr:hypothetical protein GW17_00017451 [Ensete ventricosum]